MASWGETIGLIVTLAIFGGVIYAVVTIANKMNQAVASTKESLKSKGYHISESGVAVKTSARMDRESYIDATQRGVLKTMNAASFGKPGEQTNLSPPAMERGSSSTSVSSAGSGDKKTKFGFGRSNSGTPH